MPCICRKQFSSDGVPYFGGLIKGACAYSISIGYVEAHAIDSIFMSFKGMYQVASIGIPQFASSIIATCDELISIFIKAAIGQW